MFTVQDGWVIEGRGVEPDIDVLSDPNAWARGKDPQLDKAIQVLMDDLAKHPVKRPVFPPDPVRVKPGGGGS
jgi:tricorn protease